MTSPEHQAELPSTPEPAPELSKELLETFVKKSLFKLEEMDETKEGFMEEAEERLAWAESNLKELEAAYPHDLDVKFLREMYEDLKKDLEDKFPMDFDSSFDQILEEMVAELEASGVRVENPETSLLSGTVQELEAIGIHPSYVVTQGDPNAPTIVLYLMVHPTPGMNQELRDLTGVTQSQNDIYSGVTAAQEAGLIDTVYTEGWGTGRELDLKEGHLRNAPIQDENAMAIGAWRAETELGDGLRLVGTEDMPLLINVSQGNGMKYRATTQNILIADNIADEVHASQEKLSLLTFGLFHESFDSIPNDGEADHEAHPVPLSHLLAYNGVNVIVVDAATPYVNFSPEEETLQELSGTKKEDPKKVEQGEQLSELERDRGPMEVTSRDL